MLVREIFRRADVEDRTEDEPTEESGGVGGSCAEAAPNGGLCACILFDPRGHGRYIWLTTVLAGSEVIDGPSTAGEAYSRRAMAFCQEVTKWREGVRKALGSRARIGQGKGAISTVLGALLGLHRLSTNKCKQSVRANSLLSLIWVQSTFDKLRGPCTR